MSYVSFLLFAAISYRIPISAFDTATARNTFSNPVISPMALVDGYFDNYEMYSSTNQLPYNWVQLVLKEAHNIVSIEVILR